MTDRCLCPEDLDGLVEGKTLPGWQDHMQSCAACRALLAEYQCFLAAEPMAGADPVAAARIIEQRLSAAWRTPSDQSSTPPQPSGSSRWSALLAGMRWRPALATMALAAALLVVFWPESTDDITDPSGLVRGLDATEQAFILRDMDLTATGRWALHWSPVDQASRYRVDVLDRTLAVVLAVPCGQDTHMELDPEALPADGHPPWFVRVVALAGNQTIESTPLRELPSRP